MTETKRRRRGDELLRAIYQATFEELGEVGYRTLSLGGIAVRAGTSKSTLYRRWSTAQDLVIEAVRNGLPEGGNLADTGKLRDDLRRALMQFAQALAGPMGAPMRVLVSEMHRDAVLAETLRARVFEPRGRELRGILTRAQERGEVHAGALEGDIPDLGHELVMFRFLTDGTVSGGQVEEILDLVVMPLLRPDLRYENELAEVKAALADAHLRIRQLEHDESDRRVG